MIRFSECFAVERNRSVSSVHLVPSASKYSAQRDWSDKQDLLYHLEAHLDLNNSWAMADDTDEIVWVNYTLEVPEKFSFKTLEDLRLVSASGFILTLTLSTGEIEFSEMESFQRAAYTRTSFNDFPGRSSGTTLLQCHILIVVLKAGFCENLPQKLIKVQRYLTWNNFWRSRGELRKRSI